jgi:uncharacterized membrane protein YgcG
MKQFRRLIIAVAISGLSLGAFAQATQTAPMAAPPPKPSATAIPQQSGDSAQADSDYQAAQAKCNAVPDVEKASCLSKAKQAFDQQKGQSSSGNTGASGGSTGGTSGSSGSNSGTGGTK